jgi:hypothetical protein
LEGESLHFFRSARQVICSELVVVDYDPPAELHAAAEAIRDAEEVAILLAAVPSPGLDDGGGASGDVASAAISPPASPGAAAFVPPLRKWGVALAFGDAGSEME